VQLLNRSVASADARAALAHALPGANVTFLMIAAAANRPDVVRRLLLASPPPPPPAAAAAAEGAKAKDAKAAASAPAAGIGEDAVLLDRGTRLRGDDGAACGQAASPMVLRVVAKSTRIAAWRLPRLCHAGPIG
jgi:pimeloyl-ACP methyl ester carboxylesterase